MTEHVSTVAASHIDRIPIEAFGTGTATVVFANQSDETLCAWLPFAKTLVTSGYRVVAWDYGLGSPPDEVAAIAAAAHVAGARHVIMMGASKGAKASLIAATQMTRGGKARYVDGVVSLSAEATLPPHIDVARASAGLRIPALLLTATDDSFGAETAIDAIQRAVLRPTVVRVPGNDHGTALLTHPGVVDAVLEFLARTTR
jgi:hypothetical protein